MKNFIPLVISPLFLLLSTGVQAEFEHANVDGSYGSLKTKHIRLRTSDSFNYWKRFVKLESLSLNNWDDSFAPIQTSAPKSLIRLRFVNSKLLAITDNRLRLQQLSRLDITNERSFNSQQIFSVAGKLPDLREFRTDFFERNRFTINAGLLPLKVRQLNIHRSSLTIARVPDFTNDYNRSLAFSKPAIRRHDEHLRALFPKKSECWLDSDCSVFNRSVGFYNALQMNSVRQLLQDRPTLYLHLTKKASNIGVVRVGKLRFPLNKKKRSWTDSL